MKKFLVLSLAIAACNFEFPKRGIVSETDPSQPTLPEPVDETPPVAIEPECSSDDDCNNIAPTNSCFQVLCNEHQECEQALVTPDCHLSICEDMADGTGCHPADGTNGICLNNDCVMPVCGDGICTVLGSDFAEAIFTCPQDCGAENSSCGDGMCLGNEDCTTCFTDCGHCANLALTDGVVIKGTSDLLYYYTAGQKHLFPDDVTFSSWYPDGTAITQLTDGEMLAIPMGMDVVIRPGTYLVNRSNTSEIYAVKPAGEITHICNLGDSNETNCTALYGQEWKDRVTIVTDASWQNYTPDKPLSFNLTDELSAGQFFCIRPEMDFGACDWYLVMQNGYARSINFSFLDDLQIAKWMPVYLTAPPTGIFLDTEKPIVKAIVEILLDVSQEAFYEEPLYP